MFFTKLATTLALSALLVSALTIGTPSGWTSGGTASLTWTTESGDPDTFSIELVNELNGQFALANNVESSQQSISFTLPTVSEGDDYTVEFVNITDATDIYAESGTFSIAASSSSSISSASTSSVTASSASATGASSSAASASGSGTTRSSTATAASATSTGTGTGSASGAAGSSTASDSSAVALGISNVNLASFGVMAVVALASTRLVGF